MSVQCPIANMLPIRCAVFEHTSWDEPRTFDSIPNLAKQQSGPLIICTNTAGVAQEISECLTRLYMSHCFTWSFWCERLMMESWLPISPCLVASTMSSRQSQTSRAFQSGCNSHDSHVSCLKNKSLTVLDLSLHLFLHGFKLCLHLPFCIEERKKSL